MLEKNIDTFANVLEEMNMKETANAFRVEFRSKSNDEYELGKYNILKHLQTQLNRCTGSNYSNKFTPTKKKKQRDHSDIFDSFISKLANKKKEENSSESTIDTSSKVYLHLSEKIEKDYKNSKNKNKISFSTSQQYNYYEDIDINNGDNNIPCFGSAKKDIIDTLPLKKEEEVVNHNNSDINLDEEKMKQINKSFGDMMNDDSNKSETVNDNSVDEYTDDDDVGYELYECDEEYFKDTCNKLSEANDFPQRAVYKSKYKNYSLSTEKAVSLNKNVKNKKINLVTETKSNKNISA